MLQTWRKQIKKQSGTQKQCKNKPPPKYLQKTQKSFACRSLLPCSGTMHQFQVWEPGVAACKNSACVPVVCNRGQGFMLLCRYQTVLAGHASNAHVEKTRRCFERVVSRPDSRQYWMPCGWDRLYIGAESWCVEWGGTYVQKQIMNTARACGVCPGCNRVRRFRFSSERLYIIRWYESQTFHRPDRSRMRLRV
jgi:hypothetical protein